MRRRDVLGAAGGLAGMAATGLASARPSGATRAWWFYASVGSRLLGFQVDPARGVLRQVHEGVAAAEEVQSGVQHAASGRLYIASSDLNTRRQGRHLLEAFAVDRTGALRPLGEPLTLSSRPIDVTVETSGRYVLTAHNKPAEVQAHTVAADGGLSGTVAQRSGLDVGVYPHQVRFFPDQRAVLVPARGNDPSKSAPEDPGALKVFAFHEGRLEAAQSVSPGGGLGYRPRHAVFHPSGRWLYVDLESQNQVQAYAVRGDRISPEPIFTTGTLSGPARKGQLVSAILVHPDGRSLYVANRGAAAGPEGEGGENTVAVFRLDPRTGEPRLMQSAPIAGVHARTMALSPDGRWLAAATIQPALMGRPGEQRIAPAGLSLFRVAGNGRLRPSFKLDLDTRDGPVFWVGAVAARPSI